MVYAIFCVYMIFIILCKKTLTSRNAQNFLRAKIFYTFLFVSLSKRTESAKTFIFQQISISFNQNSSKYNAKSTKNKKITQKCEQPPKSDGEKRKSVISIDNRAKKC